MTAAAVEFLPGVGVPQAQGPVVAAGGDHLPVGGEGHGREVSGVPLELPQLLSGGGVAQAHDVQVADHGLELAVG